MTYADMLLRGRPSSGVPAQGAGAMADAACFSPLSTDNDDEAAQNRRNAAGALLGYVSGVGISAAYAGRRTARGQSHPVRTGVMLGLAAMADIPIVLTGNGDPRTWSAVDWLSDLIPHLAYGLVSAAVLERR